MLYISYISTYNFSLVWITIFFFNKGYFSQYGWVCYELAVIEILLKIVMFLLEYEKMISI